MNTYKILFIGDVVGRPGRTALKQYLPRLKQMHQPLFTVVNGENASGGVGISVSNAEEFFREGVDAITLGNHALNKRDIYPFLDTHPAIVRPYNMPTAAPGKGICYVERDGVRLAVMNFCGRVYMDSYGDPFNEIDQLLPEVETPHRLVDFHGEATSEKVAMGWHLDGRVSAVVGTHTHVTTADETVLPQGTAYITDVGMTGPVRSVLGVDRDIILQRFRTSVPRRFEVANEPGVICGVVISVIRDTGRAESIERVRLGEEN